jgi:acetaldehyde dehydrogenase (acetylating)
MSYENKLRVAIIGSGNIGTDLLIKVLRSPVLECTLFVGRNLKSPGLAKALSLGVPISARSIEALTADPDCYDLVFDATSALDHVRHWPTLKRMGKMVIDLTPARLGAMCVPAVNLDVILSEQNVSMITCGGQTSAPLAHAIGQTQREVEYIEVVSSIASRSAGPATRLNIDEYVETTEKALQHFSGCQRTKAILILNPAVPCIDMQTTIFAKVRNLDLDALSKAVQAVVPRLQTYVPGYQVILGPLIEYGRVIITVRVQGSGDYLPKYSGNLDIINCAAIATAEAFHRCRRNGHDGSRQ